MSANAPDWEEVDWPSVTRRRRGVEYVVLGEGPPLVFIHGLGGAWQNWLENLPALAATHRCIALDLPGFGASEPLEGDVSISRFAEVVHELLIEEGAEGAAVVGNSMGGFIALEMALRFGVERLVLASAAVLWQEYRRAQPLVALANVTEGLVGRALAELPLRLVMRPRFRELALGFGGVRAPRRLSRELQRETILTARRTPSFLPALQALANYPLREELSDVAVPTLIVWGESDTLVGVEHAHELAEAIPGAELIVYERTGHLPMLERPDRFNADLATFLAVRERS